MSNDIKLIHRVTLQRLQQGSPGPTGGDDDGDTWTAIGTYWAYVRALQGRELVNAREQVATVSHNVSLRVIGPITPQDRLLFQSRVFGIGAVLREDERPVWYQILATELVGQTP